MKRLLIIISLMMFACIGMQAQKHHMILTLHWSPQCQFAGYYAALEKGFYCEAGLDVEIKHPEKSTPWYKELQDNQCQSITMTLLNAIKCYDSGYPVVNILQTSQQNATLICMHNKNIQTLNGLNGCNIGTWNMIPSDPIKIFAKKQNLSINWIPYGSTMLLFASGAVDGITAMDYNDYQSCISTGQASDVVFRIKDYGVNIPEEGLYVSWDYYTKYRKQCDKFAEASRKGWLWVEQHPEEAIKIVMKYMQKAHKTINPTLQRIQLKLVLQYQKKDNEDTPSFKLQEKDVREASDAMYKYEISKRKVTYEEITGISAPARNK